MTISKKRKMILQVAISLLIFSLLEEVSTEGSSTLTNIATYEGHQNTIMNLAADSNNVSWTVIPTSDEFGSYQISDYGGQTDPSLTGLFYLNQSGLIIINATTTEYGGPISTSGLYISQSENSGDRTGAKLLVVREPPVCSCNAAPNVVDLSCSVLYADGSLHPINANMTWKIGDVVYTTESPVRNRIDYYVFESISTITVDSSISDNFTCTVAFNAPTDIEYDFIATNAPEFSASCSVEVCSLPTTTTREATTATQPSTTETRTTPSSDPFQNMENTAVYEGDMNMIMNLAADPNDVRWTIIPTTDEFGSYQISDYDGYRDPSLTGLFYLNESGLVILNATTSPNDEGPISTSGLYIADRESNGNRTGAKLLVVREPPKCSCNASSSSASQLSCSIFYADGSLHPMNANMTWKIGDVIYTTDTPPRARIDYYVFQSTSTIVVDNSVPQNYTCTVGFNAPTDIVYDFIATNAPNFSASCSVEVCSLPTTTTNEATTATQPSTTETPTTSASDSFHNMKNIAAYEGNLNLIMNLAAYPNDVRWTIIPTTDEFGSYQISDYGGYRDPSFTGLFYLNESGLVILNATTAPNGEDPISTSGLYIADLETNGNRTGAKLLVVREPPKCSCNASTSSASQLSCSIFYADGSLHPINANMTWTTSDVVYTTDTPPRARIDYYVFESTSTITVNNSVAQNFTCTVAYNEPTDIVYDFIATNAPEFIASCSVEVCSLPTTTTNEATTATQPSTTETQTTSSSMFELNEATTATQPRTTETSTTSASDPFQNMKNMVVYEGDMNLIMNLAADPNDVKWTIIPTTDEFGSYQISDYGGYRDPSLTGLFYLNQSGLVIINATTAPNDEGPISTSGLYIADLETNGNRTGAKLLVVREPPVCSCNALPNAAQLSCSIFYADGSLHPIDANMTWTSSDVIYTTDTPPRARIDYYVFESTSTITVNNSVVQNFTCTVAYNEPTDIVYDFIATNSPDFSASCSVEVCSLPTTTANEATTATQPSTTETQTTLSSMFELNDGTTATQPRTSETPTTSASDPFQNMKNIAVYEGHMNMIMNLAADPNDVRWTIIPTTDEFGSYQISDYDGYRDPSLSGLFYLNESGLVILNATTAPNGEEPISTSGLYIADRETNGNRTGAKLLVVREPPVCSCNALPDAAQLSCSVFYADGSLHPMNANMTWTSSDVVHTTDTPPRARIDYYVFESTSTITVNNSVAQNFTCTVAYNEPTDIVYDFIATNAPDFSASCSVEVCSLPTTTNEATTAIQPSTTETPTISSSMFELNEATTATQPSTTDAPTTSASDSFLNMKNIAVYEGDLNMIMNLASDPIDVRWTIIPTTDEFGSYTISDYGGYRDPSLTGLFYLNESGLVIINATTSPNAKGPISTSGLYIVDLKTNGNRTGAKLLVVREPPVCSCNAAQNSANLSCSIFYADGSLHPIDANMTWATSDVVYTTDTPPRARIDYYVFESTSTITVNNSVAQNFTCTVAFNEPTDIVYDFIATNAPEFSASCSVEVCSLLTTSTREATTATQPGTTETPTTSSSMFELNETTTATQPATPDVPTTSASDSFQNMKNIAVYQGDLNMTMNLAADPTDVRWTIIPTSDEFGSYTISDYGGQRDSSLSGLFYPDQSGLVILNATIFPNGEDSISTSGLYIADRETSGNRKGAKLLVVREPPECSCNASSPNAIQLICSVIYADCTIHPIYASMTWKIADVVYTTDRPPMIRIDEYTFKSTSTITVDNSVPETFTCIVTFNAPTDIIYAFIATNVPEFIASCSVEVCGLATNTQPPTIEPQPNTSGYCMTNMRNMAVREGTLNVPINVTSNYSCAVTWSVVPTTNEFGGGEIINPDCVGDPSLEILYSVNASGLIIRNSTTTEAGHPISTSGLYVAECKNNGSRMGAKFVVVRSGPTCSCVSEGSNIQLTCSADFADSTINSIPAIMTWIVNGDYYSTDTPYRNKTDGYVYNVASTITLDADTVYDYQCLLTFGEPTNVQYEWLAMNAPAFNESCSTNC